MVGRAKSNAMRSAVVVAAALAFGYLTVRVGFKSFIEEAQLEQQRQEALLQAQSAAAEAQDGFDDSFHTDGRTLTGGLPESDHKL